MTATVVAKNAEYADSLATALCVLGPEKALALVEKLPRVEAIVVGLQGKVAASSGLAAVCSNQTVVPFWVVVLRS